MLTAVVFNSLFTGAAMKFLDQGVPKLDILKAWVAQEDDSLSEHVGGVAIAWRKGKAPYLHVWPAVLECLKRTNLNIDPAVIPESVIHRLGTIEVRTPGKSGVKPFLLSVRRNVLFDDSKRRDSVQVSRLTGNGEVRIFACKFGDVQHFENIEQDGVGFVDEMKPLCRIAFGVLMLAADDEYCTPILLAKDRGKTFDVNGQALAIERAHRRGNIGFEIGRDVEVSPHFRRPHFAIRWTGKGGKIPRLVPVKGVIVNKRKLGEVPTGYEGIR